MSFFNFLKFHKNPSISSVNHTWNRTRYHHKSNQPISFTHANDEYVKLNNNGITAKKGTHNNVYKSGAKSTLKRYQNPQNSHMLLIKTFKVANTNQYEKQKMMAAVTDEAEKMRQLDLAYDYVIRKSKKKTTAIDIIMPYYDGEDMFEYIDKFHDNPRSLDEVIQLFEYVLAAIKALQNFHDKGWVHFDVKPDNFHIDKKNKTVRLIDPELAQLKTSLNNIRGSQIGGTPEYAAPEILENQFIKNGAAVDTCSMGLTLAAILNIMEQIGIRNNKMVEFYFDPATPQKCLPTLKNQFHLSEGQANILFQLVCDMTQDDPNKRTNLEKAKQTIETIITELKERLTAKKDVEEARPLKIR